MEAVHSDNWTWAACCLYLICGLGPLMGLGLMYFYLKWRYRDEHESYQTEIRSL